MNIHSLDDSAQADYDAERSEYDQAMRKQSIRDDVEWVISTTDPDGLLAHFEHPDTDLAKMCSAIHQEDATYLGMIIIASIKNQALIDSRHAHNGRITLRGAIK